MGNSGGKLVLTDQTISDIVQSSGQSRSQVDPGVSFLLLGGRSDMEFVQNFTPPDFQAKNFTPSISPNFNSFSKKKHKK